ncbi:MAG: anti-sigma factor family protein [Pseudomonadota bacterium]
MNDAQPLTDEDLVALMADPARTDIAERLRDDPDAARRLADWRAQDAALRALLDPVLEAPVPERLTAALARPRPLRHGRGREIARRAAAMAALLLVGAAGGWTLARLDPPAGSSPAVAEAALDAHRTFVVEVAHPVEVTAAETAHLTGWLSKRLGHPITAPDFAALGFRLMGGRILPAGAATAALLMYEDDLGHRVTLYVTPEAGSAETAFRFAERGSEQSFWWIDGDFGYAVTGDIPRDRLRALALAAYDQLV